MLSRRTGRVSVSPTQQVTIEADRLQREGIDVVDLGAGEPDFATPAHIKTAGLAAISGDFTKYTPNAGIQELREAIAARYRADYGIRYAPADVIVTAGGKQALFNTAMALYDPGDEVITHAPGWPSLVDQIKLADADPVVVRTHPEDSFSLRADTVLEAIGPRTKAIVINSPGNPTGALVSEVDLARIADRARTDGIWIVLDLCYEQLIYDDTPHNLPRVLADHHPDGSVIVGSLSKRYAMTGWRCGWAIGPAQLIEACNVIQSHATSNVSSITQHAGIEALSGPQTCVTEMRDAYRHRRDQLLTWLAEEQRIRCVKPGGAFYLFPDVSDLLSPDGYRTSTELAQALLRHSHVAVTPGEAFDAPGFLRVSYAASLERLEEGVARLRTFIKSLNQ
jgi:aspartate aminotransferase